MMFGLAIKATIMPGVKVGSGAIIASKSVVVNDVPAYSVAGGNPSQVIKYRFDESTINELLEIAWWHWEAENITEILEAIVAWESAALRYASVF